MRDRDHVLTSIDGAVRDRETSADAMRWAARHPLMPETQPRLRGHAFLPPARLLRKIPGAYATDSVPAAQKVIWVHYFCAAGDWWLAELWHDEEDDRWTGFGYARLAAMPEMAEWGDIDLAELEALRARGRGGLPVLVERDLHWKPVPFRRLPL